MDITTMQNPTARKKTFLAAGLLLKCGSEF